jgi:hypothetical protein
MEFVTHALLVGIGATLTVDLWAAIRRPLLGTPLPNYALVGRWLAHMVRGRFRHERIAAATPVQGELAVGWVAHYLTGVIFAALWLAIVGPEWGREPSLGPALAFGIATVAAPFFLMQPGMGAGVAAARTAHPNAARLQSLVFHAVFGAGLYASAITLAAFART